MHDCGLTSRRSGAALARRALAGVLASMFLLWLTIVGSPAANADALCDALRAQYGPGYPCVGVPTNTFTPPPVPTATLPTPGNDDTTRPTSGPGVGIDVGPGPGVGNGTPIVPVPTAPAPRPVPQAGDEPSSTVEDGPIGVTPGAPGASVPVRPPSPVPSPTRAPNAPPVPRQIDTDVPAGTTPRRTPDGDRDPDTVAWLIVAVTAFTAAHPRAGRAMRQAVAGTGGLVGRWNAYRHQGTNPPAPRTHPDGDQQPLVSDGSDSPYQPIADAVPVGGRALQNPDGSVVVIDASGAVAQKYSAVTAFDASGRPVPVYFVTEGGGGVIRVIDVDESTAYPVVLTPSPAGPGDPTAHVAGAVAEFAARSPSATETGSPTRGSADAGGAGEDFASRLAVF